MRHSPLVPRQIRYMSPFPPESHRDDASRGRRSPLSRLIRSVLAGGIVFFALAVVGYATGMRVNLSGSIPPGLYRIDRGPIVRGAIVLACLPPMTSRFARDRGYVPSGACDDGRAPVGKTVGAVAGDTVDVTERGVAVNGRLLPNTAALSKDSEGRPLPAMRIRRHVVPISEVWLLSTYSARSFDSRYYGGIHASRITVRVQPIIAPTK
jgi:conjugative transfer signal peptidase TraF